LRKIIRSATHPLGGGSACPRSGEGRRDCEPPGQAVRFRRAVSTSMRWSSTIVVSSRPHAGWRRTGRSRRGRGPSVGSDTHAGITSVVSLRHLHLADPGTQAHRGAVLHAGAARHRSGCISRVQRALPFTRWLLCSRSCCCARDAVRSAPARTGCASNDRRRARRQARAGTSGAQAEAPISGASRRNRWEPAARAPRRCSTRATSER